jgi:hypothetical protein
MPNSRIESSGLWSEDQLELLGAWTTDGNNLLSGGGQVLGSLDNFPFYFITNGLRRGGWSESGEFFLCDSFSSPDSYLREKVKKIETLSDEESVAYSIYMPDDTMMNFSFKVLYLNKDGSSFGTLGRDITALRKGSSINFSSETYSVSERKGNKETKTFVRQNGNLVEFGVKGIQATSLKWSCQFKYQGITNY